MSPSSSFCIILTILLTKIPPLTSESPPPTPKPSFSSRFLDSILQDHAFRSFPRHRPKTGVVYDGDVPENLAVAAVAALRLRSGSLRKRGFVGFKEFDIPKGVVENPYVERLVLVYHDLGNWSEVYYPLPEFVYLSPVVGLLAYNAVDLTAKGLPELDLRSSEDPILVKFHALKTSPVMGSPEKSPEMSSPVSPVCVFFDLFGGVAFDKVLNGSVCSIVTQGHVGIAVEKGSPAPAPVEYPIAGGRGGGGGGGGRRNRGWWVGGSVAGGVLLVALVVVLVLWVRWCRGTKRMEKMKDAAERGVPLAVAAVGRAEVPVAMGTRTKPVLESEFVS